MNLKDLIYISFHFIKIKFLESLMVILGLALGVAIISSLFSLVNAYNLEIKTKSNDPTQRAIRIESNGGNALPPDIGRPVTKIVNKPTNQIKFAFNDLKKVKNTCPDITCGYIEYGTRFSVPDNSSLDNLGKTEIKDFECKMVSCEYFIANNLKIASGSLFTKFDVNNANSVIVLGGTLAKKLFPTERTESIVGKRITLFSTNQGSNITLTIIGVLKCVPREFASPGGPPDINPMGNNGKAFCPYTLSTQYKSQNGFDSLIFTVDNINHLKNAVSQLKNYFYGNYGNNSVQIHSALNWEKDQKRIIIPLFSIITLFVSAGLFMATINILNLMLARITRRKKDIGISMAIGASRFDIFKLFLTESLTLGVVGGIIGCFIAFGLSRLLQLLLNPTSVGGGPQMDVLKEAGPRINITLPIIITVLILTLIINAIFAIYPAYKASRTEAIEVLRTN